MIYQGSGDQTAVAFAETGVLGLRFFRAARLGRAVAAPSDRHDRFHGAGRPQGRPSFTMQTPYLLQPYLLH